MPYRFAACQRFSPMRFRFKFCVAEKAVHIGETTKAIRFSLASLSLHLCLCFGSSKSQGKPVSSLIVVPYAVPAFMP